MCVCVFVCVLVCPEFSVRRWLTLPAVRRAHSAPQTHPPCPNITEMNIVLNKFTSRMKGAPPMRDTPRIVDIVNVTPCSLCCCLHTHYGID